MQQLNKTDNFTEESCSHQKHVLELGCHDVATLDQTRHADAASMNETTEGHKANVYTARFHHRKDIVASDSHRQP